MYTFIIFYESNKYNRYIIPIICTFQIVEMYKLFEHYLHKLQNAKYIITSKHTTNRRTE